MNNVRTLKIVLVAVIIVSAVFLGYGAYKNEQLESKVAVFSENIQSVKTEVDAKKEVAAFVASTQPAPSLALSASAKKESSGSGNSPWCHLFNLPGIRDCPNGSGTPNIDNSDFGGSYDDAWMNGEFITPIDQYNDPLDQDGDGMPDPVR